MRMEKVADFFGQMAIFFVLVIAALVSPTIGGSTCATAPCCRCTCCSGNSCAPVDVGSVPVQACASCTSSVCNVNFPSSCPASGAAGSNGASCISSTSSSSTTTPASSGPTVWGGTYQVNSGGCSLSQCCCASGTVTMTQSGTTVSGSMGLAGQCGGSTLLPFTFVLATPTSTSANTQWVTGQPLTIVKNGPTVTLTNNAASQCSGSATCTSGDCLRSASSVCFHELTRIVYKGAVHSLSDFKEGRVPECRVPHIVRSSNGVRIETTCSNGWLRLTGDHLVFTSNGLRAASTIVPGDVLYGDPEQTQACRVVRVTKEHEQQLYFGLNCVESEVLADGLKASTFGRFHAIPAAWMKFGSKLIGVERASRLGDTIVQWLSAIKLL